MRLLSVAFCAGLIAASLASTPCADATTVTVSLEADAETVTVSVTDDGTGMPSRLRRDTAGIAGMRERALLVGGRLSIESRPGEGTAVRLVVPLAREDA